MMQPFVKQIASAGLLLLLAACSNSYPIIPGTYQSGVNGVEPLPADEPVELIIVNKDQVRLTVAGKTWQVFQVVPLPKSQRAEGCYTNFSHAKMERWKLIPKDTKQQQPVYLHAACGGINGVVISTDTKTVLFGTPE